MNSSLPKDCNCNETSANQGGVCTNAAHTTDEFFYNGPNSSCTELQNHDDVTTAIQKLENFFCSIEVVQVFLTYLELHIQEFPEFITLVNDAFSCDSVINCFTPQSICFIISTECETGNCPETFYVTPLPYINDRPSYLIEGTFQVFYNPTLNRWESWVDTDLSSYLESNLFYPAGVWLPVIPGPYVSFSDNTICPTTTTTTTVGPCIEYSWESFGVNTSSLVYRNCARDIITIDSTNVTNNSGIICVHPNTVPSWVPIPSTGYHQIGTVHTPCVDTTTTTTSTSTSTSTTTTTSTSSSTTTTTTTAVPICTAYTLQSNITNASWTALTCDSVPTGGVVPIIGNTADTGCIFDNSLVLTGMSINVQAQCTTTTTSTSTSTTTSSTTSTTTTLYSCKSKQLLIINNTANTVNDVYATSWSITAPPFVSPYSSTSGIQNGTTHAINVDMMYPVTDPGCISLYVNTVLIQSISFYYDGVYIFNPHTISSTDCVWIIVNSGEC